MVVHDDREEVLDESFVSLHTHSVVVRLSHNLALCMFLIPSFTLPNPV